LNLALQAYLYLSAESCGGGGGSGGGGGGGSGTRLYNSRWSAPVTEENGNLTNTHHSFSRPTLQKADAIDVADSKLIFFLINPLTAMFLNQ
jgi:hypothetical protein